MNVLLWIVQVVLALFALAGGSYKVVMADQLTQLPATSALPHGLWVAIGVFEIVCGVLLVVPRLSRFGAAALAVENLILAVFYARTSVAIAATNPLVWVVFMAVTAGLVAWGRFTRAR